MSIYLFYRENQEHFFSKRKKLTVKNNQLFICFFITSTRDDTLVSLF